MKGNNSAMYIALIATLGTIATAVLEFGVGKIDLGPIKYYLFPSLITLVAVIVTYLIAKKKFLAQSKKVETKTYNKINYSQHSFFVRIEDVIRWSKYEMVLKNKTREYIIKIVLTKAFNVYKKSITDFINYLPKVKNLEDNKLRDMIFEVYNQIGDKIASFHKGNEKYSNVEKSILTEIIKEFLNIRNGQSSYIKTLMEDIIMDNRYYGSIEVKIGILMNIFLNQIYYLQMMTEQLDMNCRKQIKSLKWKGQVIGD